MTISGPGKFIELDSAGENIVPIAPIPSSQNSEISKKIEQCKIVNRTGDCDNIPSTEDYGMVSSWLNSTNDSHQGFASNSKNKQNTQHPLDSRIMTKTRSDTMLKTNAERVEQTPNRWFQNSKLKMIIYWVVVSRLG